MAEILGGFMVMRLALLEYDLFIYAAFGWERSTHASKRASGRSNQRKRQTSCNIRMPARAARILVIRFLDTTHNSRDVFETSHQVGERS